MLVKTPSGAHRVAYAVCIYKYVHTTITTKTIVAMCESECLFCFQFARSVITCTSPSASPSVIVTESFRVT